ncbi:MAG: ABC transporter substrate-binding protein [Betaproteobacteria bacterium]|nr:MAG: ABC transporter substrate-binding protein [Betaproteobacteria bacterium]
MADSRRRNWLLATGALLVAPVIASAQRPGTYRIGFVSPTRPGQRNEAFLQGLREHGYVDGRDIVVEMRFADGRPERLPGLVQELLRLDIDVLVVGATIGARAAKKATSAVPIVFAGSSDPVAGGIVTNLARPGGNITGFSTAYGDGFAGKWLELLKEAVPSVSSVAVLWSSSNAAASRFVTELQAAARELQVNVGVYHAANLAELDKALAAIGGSGAQGLIVTPSPFAATQRDRLVEFAASKRLPAVYFVENFPDAGGLMSYGPSIADTYRRAASHVDKILKGARPGDLPVEQPTRFQLVVNLRTAQALGLTVPRVLLLRADRVID